MKKRNWFKLIVGGIGIASVMASVFEYNKNIASDNEKCTIYKNGIKRGLDVFCGCSALFIFWPLYILIGTMVKIKMGGSILFTQERPGKNEKIFKLYKFRTMTEKKDEQGNLLPDEQRLTKFGKWLRTTSLDELPEVFNIIKGDMSVIGPRPLLVQYLDRYNEYQKRRHDVRPGLSGYAQTHGRNRITWEEKFDYDVWYTENISFKLDLKIIKDTIIQAFFKREGINAEGSATMPEFMGTEEQKEK